MAYVRWFDGGHEPRVRTFGGKCASLVALTAAGLPVPPGFAVTTAAYDAFVAASGLSERIDRALAALDPADVSTVDTVSAGIRDAVLDEPMPADIEAQVHRAYDELGVRCGPATPVAVRSSATAEDLPGASFAGQQDTYLWITGADAVIEHVRRCWASLYTSRAIVYRRRNDIHPDGLSMAVAVQAMVRARVSGVALTMNPTNGDRSKLVIDASYGLGEPIVSGRVTPDHVMIDKVLFAVVAETVGSKHVEMVVDGTTLVERPVEAARRIRRCLTTDEVDAVARLAKRAEGHYGCPQDVEWAIDVAGTEPVLLQSRPETVHSGRTAPRPAPPVSPLLASLRLDRLPVRPPTGSPT
jgi:pyruvate,water dikinase